MPHRAIAYNKSRVLKCYSRSRRNGDHAGALNFRLVNSRTHRGVPPLVSPGRTRHRPRQSRVPPRSSSRSIRADVKAISPWIYGSNSTNIANRTFDRSGGNRTTGYNWENNASNAGADWYHHSDYGMANNNENARQVRPSAA